MSYKAKMVKKSVLLTPKQAQALWDRHVLACEKRLEKHQNGVTTPAGFVFIKNRNVRPTKVDEYADVMRAGGWVDDFTPIRIAIDGAIFDGQHRILACIRANTPVRVTIYTNVPDEIAETIDTGQVRLDRDRMAMAARHDAKHRMSTVAWLWRAEDPEDRIHPRYRANPAAVVFDIEAKYAEELDEMLPLSHQLFSKTTRSAALLLAFWIIQRRKHGAKADQFFTALGDGVGLQKTDQVYVLRERMRQNVGSTAKVKSDTIWCWVESAWKAYLSGKKIKILKSPSKGKGKITPDKVAKGEGEKVNPPPKKVSKSKLGLEALL